MAITNYNSLYKNNPYDINSFANDWGGMGTLTPTQKTFRQTFTDMGDLTDGLDMQNLYIKDNYSQNPPIKKDSGFGFNKGTADTIFALAGWDEGRKAAKEAKEANRLMSINMDRNYDFDIDNLQGAQVAFRNELKRNQHNANMMGYKGELESLPESKALANYNKQYNS